jgi:hypothetical protein
VLVLALLVRLTTLPEPELVADDLAVIVSSLLVAATGLVYWHQRRSPNRQ